MKKNQVVSECCGSGVTTDELRSIREWWNELQQLPAEKARLRATPVSETSRLSEELQSQLYRHEPCGVLLLAHLLSNIDVDDRETRFLCKLASSDRDRPALSSVHFRRLKECRTLDELFRRFRRAVVFLGRAVDVTSVSECTIDWADAHHPRYDADRGLELEARWGNEFCTSSPGTLEAGAPMLEDGV